jgi:predicted DNA-binding transcriptional regulator AlpA
MTIQAHVDNGYLGDGASITIYAADEDGRQIGEETFVPLTLDADERIVEDIPTVLRAAGYEIVPGTGTDTEYGYAVEVAPIESTAVYLSMPEIAERAGLAEQTVRQYRSRGRLPHPDAMIGRTPGWQVATADAWIATLPGQGARTDLRRQRVDGYDVIRVADGQSDYDPEDVGKLAIQHDGQLEAFADDLDTARAHISAATGTAVELTPAESYHGESRWTAHAI